MQTDTKLAPPSQPDQCPLCYKPLKQGARTCYFCGFSLTPDEHGAPSRARRQNSEQRSPRRVPNPVTPIPARASAQADMRGGRVSSTPLWRHRSQSYEAESSLASLSLVVADLPTQPARPSVPPKITQRLTHLAEIDTLPPPPQPATRALVPASPRASVLAASVSAPVDAASWTAGGATVSPQARKLLERRPTRSQHVFSNPFDRLRWWLLRPGRIEFLLWIGGTVLLMSVTCVLLLITALSLGWLSPAQRYAVLPSSATPAVQRQSQAPIPASTPGLSLHLVDRGTLYAGQMLRVQGGGFRPDSAIQFSLDGQSALLDTHGQLLEVRTNPQGIFTASLQLKASWPLGQHWLIAREMATRHQAVLMFELQGRTGATPAVRPTSPVVNGGGNPPQPGQPTPPVVRTPLPRPTPTPRPRPSPTVAPTPTSQPTPTVQVTPTPAATQGIITTPVAQTPGPAAWHATLTVAQASALPAHAVDHWWYVLLPLYSLALALLWLAGLLHRRRRGSEDF